MTHQTLPDGMRANPNTRRTSLGLVWAPSTASSASSPGRDHAVADRQLLQLARFRSRQDRASQLAAVGREHFRQDQALQVAGLPALVATGGLVRGADREAQPAVFAGHRPAQEQSRLTRRWLRMARIPLRSR